MRVLCLLLLASLATAQSFPCDNCRMLVPDSYDGEPTPLLVALHGDEGTSEHIYTAYRRHVEASGWLMVSLECPRDLGCWSGSWYEWENTGGHDWDWLGRQVDAVAAEYNVDPNAVHLTGWSGGAQYLGRYAVRFAERYAGVAYIGGGVPSRRAECPACEIPAYFLIGSRDFNGGGKRCPRWAASRRSLAQVQVYSGIHHGFDKRGEQRFSSRDRTRAGKIAWKFDAATASAARRRANAHFRAVLRPQAR